MENLKHTAGQWLIYGGQIISETDGQITTVSDGQLTKDRKSFEQMKEIETANAKLIAAAPDLLEALIKVEEYAKEFGMNQNVWKLVNNAIKKATE